MGEAEWEAKQASPSHLGCEWVHNTYVSNYGAIICTFQFDLLYPNQLWLCTTLCIVLAPSENTNKDNNIIILLCITF